MEKIIEKRIRHVIFIIKSKLTIPGRNFLLASKRVSKEIFLFKEIIVNPVKHYLVPRHERISSESARQLLKTVGSKIPAIKITDRICRHYNGKVGQIFKIYRKNHLYYRIVTK